MLKKLKRLYGSERNLILDSRANYLRYGLTWKQLNKTAKLSLGRSKAT